MVLMLSLCWMGCTREDDVAADVTLDDGSQAALELVNAFRQSVNQNDSRAAMPDDLEILGVDKQSISFKKVDASGAELSRTAAEPVKDVDMYTFTFLKGEKKGFAISVPDERVNQVLAYCENGSLADTAYIEGLAMVIRELPWVCARYLDEYENEPQSRATVTEFITDNFMKMEWDQDWPYNKYCPEKGCTDSRLHGHAWAGCVAVATAQALAYVGWKPYGYDFGALRGVATITDNSPHADEVARLIYEVAEGCNMEYGCDGSSSSLQSARDYLLALGFNKNMADPCFTYKKSSSFSNDLMYMAIGLLRKPVAARGRMKKGDGHMWLYTGVKGLFSSTDGVQRITHLYCNWGWGGSSNGWYSEEDGFNQPRNDYTHEPETARPFNNENAYIYFGI